MIGRRACWLLALAGMLACSPAATADEARLGRPVSVETKPISFETARPRRLRFGRLAWRGGIEITKTSDARLGGLSGLTISRDGRRFVAVSDRALWVTGTLSYDRDTLSGLGDVRIGPLLDPAGKPVSGRGKKDAETVEADSIKGLEGPLLVGFERVERIARYDFAARGMAARAEYLPLTNAIAKGPNNKELEAAGRVLQYGPLKGRIIVISERHLDEEGHIRGWIQDGKKAEPFAVRRIGDYDITDLAFHPNGDLLLLERRFGLITGLGMLIRRIPAREIKPGAVLSGSVLLDAGSAYQIDNMEGLAVHRDSSGETRLTLVSDDNYNAGQRTLILQFALVE